MENLDLTERLRELFRLNAQRAVVPAAIENPVTIVEEPKTMKRTTPQQPVNTETPGWEHTVFKTTEGAFYAVSQRALGMGYVPQSGTVQATELERYEFYKNTVIRNSPPITPSNRIEAAQKLKEFNIDPLMIKTLTGIDLTESD